MGSLPSRTVTCLFAKIKGTTQLLHTVDGMISLGLPHCFVKMEFVMIGFLVTASTCSGSRLVV